MEKVEKFEYEKRIEEISEIKTLKDFIDYNEKIAEELTAYKESYKKGFSSREEMNKEILERTNYSSKVYKNVMNRLYNSNNISKDEKAKMDKTINHNYKGFTDRKGRHHSTDFIGYTKVYDTKNFCEYLSNLAKIAGLDLDKEIEDETKKYVVDTKKAMENTKPVVAHHKGRNYNHLNAKKAENAADRVNKLYEVGYAGGHFEYFELHDNGYTSLINATKERLATHDGMSEEKALYDKIKMHQTLESKHNSRGFFNRLFNFRKYKREEEFIKAFGEEIKNNELYKSLKAEHENVEEHLYTSVIAPEEAVRIAEAKNKVVVGEINEKIAEHAASKLQDYTKQPRREYVITEVDEEAELEDFNIDSNEINPVENIKEM